MSEYYLDYTGAQLDDAINKVRSGYILPTEIINIVENVSNMDISKGKTLNVNVPVPDGYINLADVLNHCTRSASSEYTPTSNVTISDVEIAIKDANGNYLKPKIFVIFHNSRIENADTSVTKFALTSSITVADNDGNLLYTHAGGIYKNTTFGACGAQSASRYFNPINTGVQGIGSSYYLQSGKQYLWYAWG